MKLSLISSKCLIMFVKYVMKEIMMKIIIFWYARDVIYQFTKYVMVWENYLKKIGFVMYAKGLVLKVIYWDAYYVLKEEV